MADTIGCGIILLVSPPITPGAMPGDFFTSPLVSVSR